MKKRTIAIICCILAIGATACGSTPSKDSGDSDLSSEVIVSSEETDLPAPTESSDIDLTSIKESLLNSLGDGESISDLSLDAGTLYISIDLNDVDPAPLTLNDLAISRAGSITDSLLDLSELDDQWTNIVIDFPGVCKISNTVDNVSENEFGMKYFPEDSFSVE